MIALHHITRPLALSLAVAALVSSLPSLPAMAADTAPDQIMINSGDLKWENAPPSMPKGAKVAVLSGDPSKAGPIVVRLKLPAGYKVPPHWHTQTENLTVISGTLYMGIGDKMDTAHAHALKAGGFHVLPGKTHHYAFTKSPTVVQNNGEGPLDIVYINPADDPQKSAAQ
ncbi:cupin domain-containing protein [Undibacterium arcticum]|uniref:Cupin domain-containing protein n=1 Tax=Undibacterium arcticum TaxID=1762892 RepID=A0ABV7F2E9_9BURK